MDFIAGADEAGRGPVVGPLIISLASCSRDNERKLNSICKKDSKKLTPKQRIETFERLKGIVNFYYKEITAQDLNLKMESMSLNDIEAYEIAQLIKGLKGSADVMIDLPDRYSWVFRKRMEKFGINKYEAEHKADENYPIVAAASVFAKILRDARVEEIKKKVGFDIGSGYPSDPRTRETLKDRKKMEMLKGEIRLKWKTLENIKQRKLFE
ncbi:ribonuclease HII [Candidatus Micrarchaeota archaeon]|nr:ribonuclease HII [Candidatus Micrarchaeota archaeon]